jgi:hypothetical protein
MNKVIKIKDYQKKKTMEKLIKEKIVVVFPTLKFSIKNGKSVWEEDSKK